MLDSALRYAAASYPVLPIRPGEKTPLTPHGLTDATTDPDTIAAWWQRWPDANIGVRTDGLLVVDRDPGSEAWLADQPDKLLELATAPTVKTPRGGKHHYFSQPNGKTYSNTAGKLAPGVDTRGGSGGYVLAPPSIVDGKAYEWIEPLDCEPDRLPTPPAWLLTLLDAASRPVRVDAAHIPAGAIVEGNRNHALTSLAGTMRRVGMSPDAILAAIRQENVARCSPPLPDSEVETIAKSVSRYEPDALAAAMVDGQSDEPLERGPEDPGPTMPSDLLRVPGFISAVIDYNLSEAFKPQPAMALAGGLCLLATLTGRKVRDSVDTRTNLYCIAVGPSGCGKDRAREVNKRILHAAGLDAMLGPESLASGPGIISAVEVQPSILFQIDEIGRLLKTLGNPNQNPHLYSIGTILIKLFTSSHSIYKGDAYADAKKNRTLYQPHAVVFGTTVPESLYEGITESSCTDGFLNRMCIFEEMPAGDGPDFVAGDVPKPITDVARYWGDLRTGGNLSSQTPQPLLIATDASAKEFLLAIRTLAENEQKRLGNPLGALWMRAEEKARKLALLWACSVAHRNPQVTEEAARWACGLVEYSVRRMVHIASRWVAASPYDSKRKSVLRIIESCGPSGATKTTINNRVPIPARERNEVLQDLIECRLVVALTEPTKSKPTTRFVASRFVDQAISA